MVQPLDEIRMEKQKKLNITIIKINVLVIVLKIINKKIDLYIKLIYI